jgi:ubiquinone/menaquinone biosynthesis C-methylase UbiE
MKKTTASNGAVNADNDVDERMVPAKHKGSGIYGEHIARYEAASGIVKNKVVLDIASGSGYGTYIISQHAKQVVGVDVSKDAIKYAANTYGSKNISYKLGDGKTIPCADNFFDVVTSFETIEHLDDYKNFMKEIKRVLKPDGLLILSTPNDLEFAEGNHFHIHEFAQDELLSLAKEYYRNVEEYYQSTWKGNLIGRKEDMSSEWSATISVDQLHPIPNEKFLYFYFLCSDRKITEKVKQRFTISEHVSDKLIHNKNSLTENHIQNLEKELKSLKKDNLLKHAYITQLESRGLRFHVKKKISETGRRRGRQ